MPKNMREITTYCINMLTDKLGIFIGLILTAILYTFALSLINPIHVNNELDEPILITKGESFVLCRVVEYTRDTEVTISRALTRKIDNEFLETINFNNITVPRKKGYHNICRNIILPASISNGEWIFHTYMKVYTTPWWYTNFEAPIIKIKIQRN